MKRSLLVAALLLVFTSCSKTASSEPHDHNDHTVMVEDSTSHELGAEETKAISLNKGEKWKVNEEMKPFVNQGKVLVDSYLTTQGGDPSTLAKELTSQNDQLIQSCTMKGESHEELHKWLHPHLELVDELSKESDPSKALVIVEELKSSYQTYDEYFE